MVSIAQLHVPGQAPDVLQLARACCRPACVQQLEPAVKFGAWTTEVHRSPLRFVAKKYHQLTKTATQFQSFHSNDVICFCTATLNQKLLCTPPATALRSRRLSERTTRLSTIKASSRDLSSDGSEPSSEPAYRVLRTRQQADEEADRAKLDTSDDATFYARPRFVQHTDDGYREKLTALYRQKLRDGSRVLDLMSSWVSHLPEDLSFERVEGHGMNEAELLANTRLDHFWVQVWGLLRPGLILVA